MLAGLIPASVLKQNRSSGDVAPQNLLTVFQTHLFCLCSLEPLKRSGNILYIMTYEVLDRFANEASSELDYRCAEG